MTKERAGRWFIGLFFFSASILFGCAAQLPQSGETAEAPPETKIEAGAATMLTYSCYLENGQLAATTDPVKAGFHGNKAAIFQPPYEPGPVFVIAGDKAIQRMHTMIGPEDFDRAIAGYLARAIVGRAYGRSHRLSISAEVQKSITDSERFLKLNRHQPAKRKNRMPLASLEKLLGKAPVVGDRHPVKELPGVYIEVGAIDDDSAEILTDFKDGLTIDDPFGKKRFVAIDEEAFEVVIDTEVGHIARSGMVLGRVSAVDPQYFTMDYGDPFGGAVLSCDALATRTGR